MILGLILSSTMQVLILAASTALFLAQIATGVRKENKLRDLGGHAPRIRSWMPFGLDVIYRIVSNASRRRNIQTWQQWFPVYNNNTTREATLMTQRTIFTADPENIKAVLATQFQDFGKGEDFHNTWRAFLGDGIFATDGDMWHASRALVRPLFMKDRFSDLEVLEHHVQTLLEVILRDTKTPISHNSEYAKAGSDKEVAIGELFFRYTLDVATDFLLGQGTKTLGNIREPFEEAFEEVQRVQSILARSSSLSFFVPRSSFNQGLQTVNDFLAPFIQSVLSLPPEHLEENKSTHTFLHALATFTRDPVVLRDQLVSILIAGRDTTASALSWTLFQLSHNPRVVEKLRAEIKETIGYDGTPSYDQLKNMKYLQSVIKEILRLYPIVPYNVRVALKDTTLPRGGGKDGCSPIGVLKGNPIFYSPLFLQRRESNYPPGSDVLTFKPERWDTWQPRAWTYLPFNGGPRICLGQNFALTEISYTVVRLLQRFVKIDSCGAYEEEMLSDIVLRPANGVHVRFVEA